MCTSASLALTLQASLGIDPHLDLDDNFGGDLKGRVHVHASATVAPAAEEEVEVKKGEQLPPQLPQRLVARLASTEATEATEARVAAKMEARPVLEPEADLKALNDIVVITASAARSGVEVQAEWLEVKERGIADGAAAAQGISKGATLGPLPQIIIDGVEGNPKNEKQETQLDSTSTVKGESSSIKAIQIASAQATSHGPSTSSPTSPPHTHARTGALTPTLTFAPILIPIPT